MGISRRRVLQGLAASPAFGLMPLSAMAQDKQFSISNSLIGEAKYKQDFPHFDYVNPAAPKGGRVRLGVLGSFDSLNAYTTNGDPIDPGVHETLLTSSFDEPSASYGLIAESMWHADDYSSATFRLRPEAKFHDGEPIKPEDVIWSLEQLRANLPKQQGYYKDVVKLEKTGAQEVTFTFAVKGNRELPHIIGQFPILPKHWWEAKDANGKARDIKAASLEPQLGSGPYKLGKVVPGQSFVLERVQDYWGAALPVNIGKNNFDEIESKIFTDQAVMLEAFKGDQYDIQRESTAKGWAKGYDFPAVANGNVKKEEVPQLGVRGMQSWTLNLRRDKYKDVRVRRAFNLAFDFEWSNTNLFFDQYKRSRSFFNNSELEATGLPSPEELAILTPLKDKIPADVFTTEYTNPINTDARARRKNLQEAQKLLTEAGWKAEDQGGKRVLKNAKGDVFNVDIMLNSPAFERIALPYKEQLEILGFVVSVTYRDPSQYQKLTEEFDYDVIVGLWGQSLSPGNEQREFWTTEFANKKASANYAGIADPAVDSIVDTLIKAQDRPTLIAACRALDRVLMWNHYMVPMWFVAHERLAYWKRMAKPEKLPGYSLGYPTIWWFDEKADAEIKKS
jgi:microcin C transport system substrate-binding protein